uniref:hypothetical protein n=1 Tax=Thaumasiovibrio occultus TaxID=1891184 RepID=UPI000B35F236|nr:hypothetical protein [Thaumasiovibrio occultus]
MDERLAEDLDSIFTTWVGDAETVLGNLAQLADLPFLVGDFSAFEDRFVDSGEPEADYIIHNDNLTVTVHLEQYEGYFSLSLVGKGACFEAARAYLSRQGEI